MKELHLLHLFQNDTNERTFKYYCGKKYHFCIVAGDNVVLDRKLTIAYQVYTIVRICIYKLRMVNIIRDKLSVHVAERVVNAMVTRNLDYCNSLLHGITAGQLERLKKIGSKRHSIQVVELSQRTQAAVQIVLNIPAPSNGGPIHRFWACRPCGPDGWLALQLTKAGDVETNPGPTTLNKQAWICDICYKQIHVRKQISIRCNGIEHWVHLRCAGIRQA